MARLSRAAWNGEFDKIANWGAKGTDRDTLLEYLVSNFRDDKPVAKSAFTGDRSGQPPDGR